MKAVISSFSFFLVLVWLGACAKTDAVLQNGEGIGLGPQSNDISPETDKELENLFQGKKPDGSGGSGSSGSGSGGLPGGISLPGLGGASGKGDVIVVSKKPMANLCIEAVSRKCDDAAEAKACIKGEFSGSVNYKAEVKVGWSASVKCVENTKTVVSLFSAPINEEKQSVDFKVLADKLKQLLTEGTGNILIVVSSADELKDGSCLRAEDHVIHSAIRLPFLMGEGKFKLSAVGNVSVKLTCEK